MNDEELKKIKIEDLAPSREEKILSALKSARIPIIIVWLWKKFNDEKEDFVYAEELANFLGIKKPVAYEYLNELCRLDLLYKRKVSGRLVVEYHPTEELKKWVGKAWEEIKKRKLWKK